VLTVFPQLHVIYPGTQHFWKAVQERAFGQHGTEVFEAFTEWEAEEEPILHFLGDNFAHGVGGIPTGILHADRLRNGEFAVLDDAVSGLTEHLQALDDIEGIHLFKYGSHLASSAQTGGPLALNITDECLQTGTDIHEQGICLRPQRRLRVI
jgi:hypothetical protein